jgi:hypothetical protein
MLIKDLIDCFLVSASSDSVFFGMQLVIRTSIILGFKANKIYLESTPNAILNPRVTEIFGSFEEGSNIFLISPIM